MKGTWWRRARSSRDPSIANKKIGLAPLKGAGFLFAGSRSASNEKKMDKMAPND
jgi:hypothetical protein